MSCSALRMAISYLLALPSSTATDLLLVPLVEVPDIVRPAFRTRDTLAQKHRRDLEIQRQQRQVRKGLTRHVALDVGGLAVVDGHVQSGEERVDARVAVSAQIATGPAIRRRGD